MKNLKLNHVILHQQTQDFINQNLNTDISKLIFRGSPFENLTIQELVEQIEAKKRSEKKLPSWFYTKNIYYPNKLNIEQTSSEITAKYKSDLISGDSLIDLTGGLGIDSYHFSKQFNYVTHCEINADLSKIAQHNFEQLQIQNIQTIAKDGIIYLKSQKQFDWVYVDPSRRNDTNEKVFLLQDCLPNIPQHLETLFEHTYNILIKVSPMLDITSAINELNSVKEVHIVAIQNEVKELLFILEKSYEGPISMKTINITTNGKQIFDAIYKDSTSAEFSFPKTYLYEPNAAILKAGLFDEITKLGVHKLQQNSHLYTSEEFIDFPGRQFMIKNVISYDKKQLRKLIPSQKANITTRNFPETVAQIRKKTKLKEGGNQYLFFTTNLDKNFIIIICEKLNT